MKSKSAMQNVSFLRVEDLLDFLPDDERLMVDVLRELVFESVPDVTERLSFNVPFYKRNKSICFIWPASVLWGKKKTYEGVRFGFAKGYLMVDDIAYLDKGTRKQIYWRDFKELTSNDITILRSYLYQAVLIDEER